MSKEKEINGLLKDIKLIDEHIKYFGEKKFLFSFKKKENQDRIEKLNDAKLYLLNKLERISI